MNYLAHAYLSFEDPDILVGNMISDFIKGKKKFDYPPAVQNGILLHRKIDEYTDAHPATREARQYLKAASGAYAGSFMDIVYDYFLANDPHEFDTGVLEQFAAGTYARLSAYTGPLPENISRFLQHMRTQNWLLHYRSVEGIRRSFEGLTHRARYLSDSAPVYQAFLDHQETLKNCYELFFPNLKTFAYNELLYLSPPGQAAGR